MDLLCLKVKLATLFNQGHADHLSLNPKAIHPTPPHCELTISFQKQKLDTCSAKYFIMRCGHFGGQRSTQCWHYGRYVRINASHYRANLATYFVQIWRSEVNIALVLWLVHTVYTHALVPLKTEQILLHMYQLHTLIAQILQDNVRGSKLVLCQLQENPRN